jgi:5-methylcytosine-specific restriction endonuclease McrA
MATGNSAEGVGAGELDSDQTEWLRAHEALSRLAKERARADAEEGRWLLAALRSATHVHLGFGSFAEYIERTLGYKPRSTQEKLRVAEALEQLPLIAGALEQGSLHWSCARELTRVAIPETEQEWLDASRGKTVHQLEALVTGKGPGDKPSSPSRISERRHVLRFEVAPETFALFREAMHALRRSSGQPLDDDSALLLMARQVLVGPRDEGRASYQVALTVCPECGGATQQAGGELVPVGAEVAAMAECDGQHLGLLPSPVVNQSADTCTEPVPNSLRRSAHTGVRAKQTVPPATRRTVLRRDHHRCTLPGCKNSVFIDLHHIDLGSDGGRNDADNLVTLCGVHHRAAHLGKLRVTGSAAVGVRFQHADGSDYGLVARPQVAQLRAKAFAALRGLGFRERDVHRVLDEEARDVDGGNESLESVLRSALARLTDARARR